MRMTSTSTRMLWSIEFWGFYGQVSIGFGRVEHWTMVILGGLNSSISACIYWSLFSGI
jgi:hypothetical protein